jgi:hypothetical protein
MTYLGGILDKYIHMYLFEDCRRVMERRFFASQ